MPKKKGFKKNVGQDFTINDCANAPKPVSRVKKTAPIEAEIEEPSWDQIADDDYDIVEELNPDGTSKIVYKKKKHSKLNEFDDNDTGIVYPEIVWYLISHFVKPEDVGKFAGINRATYAITQREFFWRLLYNKYCTNKHNLPDDLRIDTSFKLYGLRQRVIRALYRSYGVFVKNTIKDDVHSGKPHGLLKYMCTNVWYDKKGSFWTVYFKFKKPQMIREHINNDFVKELGRIDANPEKDVRMLKVRCENFRELPPLMGMTLSSVRLTLSQGLRSHTLYLGFNTGHHNVSKDILPECTVVFDTVSNIVVYDWWHPCYPNFGSSLPSHINDEESVPVLKTNFFSMRDKE